jgi:hypothetical protein
MNDNERVYVKSFSASTVEDDYEKGELPNSAGSSWTDKDLRFENPEGGFESAQAALEAVCKANYFTWNKDWWTVLDGRFSGSFMVDDNNTEASPSQIEAWKRREGRIWACYVDVWLEVGTRRDMTADELAESGIQEG